MTKFCPVAPAKVLQQMFDAKVLGPLHLILAHDIIKPENQKTYERIFAMNNKSFTHVVLDNSIIELGSAVSDDIIRNAAELTLPTCIVLPDVLLDGPATVKASQEGYIRWQKVFPQHLRNYMYVPQGKTMLEFAKSAEEMLNVPNINYWGIPRNIVKHHGSRRKAIEILHILDPDRHIHLLGFSDDMIDDVICTRDPRVMGIDSAVPLRCPEPFHLTWESPPRGDWFETASLDTMMQNNLAIARYYFR